MDKNWLYDIETEMYKRLDTIKAEQAQYCAGFEKGIDMTVSAARKALNKESQSNDGSCIYCNFESSDVGADFPEPDDFKLIRGKNDNGKYDYSISTNQNNVFRICKIRFCPMCGRLLDIEEEKNV